MRKGKKKKQTNYNNLKNNTMKHYPDKWIYKKQGFNITVGNEASEQMVKHGHDYTVCKIDDNSLQAEVNAKLIAASPILLRTCQTILSNFEANKKFGTLPNQQELEAGINMLKAAIEQAAV